MPKNALEVNERLENSEKQLIRLSGAEIEPIRLHLDNYGGLSIFGLKCGDPSLPPLILLHGYLGTSIIFYKIIKDLSACYMVYCLDLMGMGRSSRPEFTAKNREEAEMFFIHPLELCRQQLGIEQMVLAGHSFGGYIAGCYCEQYPEKVSKLVLISAIGIPFPPMDPKDWLESLSWSFRNIMKFATYLLKKDVTPGSILRKLGPFTGRFVKGYLKKRWKTISKEEMKYMKIYLERVNLYPGSGEYALKEFFVEGGFAIAPLCSRIVNTPTVFIYGDRDWMDPEGARMNNEYNRQSVILKFISKSGHHMYIDNPKELTEKMISGLAELDKGYFNE
ncbi:hypothetical protein SteCoe_30476 [Stentor coeruleus]|uniref:AB hydrolase-1 domain-containing protein n=1 Tax=Stentor coeruleus TaxID=5963 RepID=A0A1R2B3M8_9CILI|nr:hypothetical protein SteCoe_30476 [Stentor coeruleus]